MSRNLATFMLILGAIMLAGCQASSEVGGIPANQVDYLVRFSEVARFDGEELASNQTLGLLEYAWTDTRVTAQMGSQAVLDVRIDPENRSVQSAKSSRLQFSGAPIPTISPTNYERLATGVWPIIANQQGGVLDIPFWLLPVPASLDRDEDLSVVSPGIAVARDGQNSTVSYHCDGCEDYKSMTYYEHLDDGPPTKVVVKNAAVHLVFERQYHSQPMPEIDAFPLVRDDFDWSSRRQAWPSFGDSPRGTILESFSAAFEDHMDGLDSKDFRLNAITHERGFDPQGLVESDFVTVQFDDLGMQERVVVAGQRPVGILESVNRWDFSRLSTEPLQSEETSLVQRARVVSISDIEGIDSLSLDQRLQLAWQDDNVPYWPAKSAVFRFNECLQGKIVAVEGSMLDGEVFSRYHKQQKC